MTGDYEYIFFDLDGTITDSAPGITNSVVYALGKFGIEVPDARELYGFIGPPLADSFERFYGFSGEKVAEAVAYYREYYTRKGMYENSVYDGLEEVLKELKAAGKKLVLATSKPEVFAREILRHFGLTDYFDQIAGAELEGGRKNKTDVILYALKLCNITDKSRVIMVGDREHDILGAKQAGIKSLGVLYGFGTREELEEAGAEDIVETVRELKKLGCGC